MDEKPNEVNPRPSNEKIEFQLNFCFRFLYFNDIFSYYVIYHEKASECFVKLAAF